ncbi:RelA/SpoT family protein [Thiococcus pfennigii]|jgi:RelA/SpoT family (p)ppGpp synthetase|uniref:RelA/SpoT family protein n=1 Tax=Thiococcus pfennigii TaxID=1057 RepID=UPI001907CB8E|nr:RelA/SpoT family protein [Thiococcus pfennigii]MBK1700257.1 bifunctional GTP diphosphokinase/guanosine-3',5'-bis(diphosphate) 3'-diphosphatase [Thiococcus pfennigii]MBK1730404.1 bifunctional GTP diphosphokinase/guanosine-3',5'-bis(diphosphate) 3'-diphosphatase [Thiococcus pfennigii]
MVAALPSSDSAAAGAETADLPVGELCTALEAYLSAEQIDDVYAAYRFGATAHEGQRRKSGEPYIHHPVAVAQILAGMRMDHKCLMAAVLHDVIEDTPTAKEQLAERFDQEIADLVDGVSKLTQMDFKSRVDAQAASFRKMMLAMTRDIRVILIKLADRLHNMRTIGAMSAEARRRISRETLEIYAPIANRLGISWLRIELEELAFANYWPWRHRVITRALQLARGDCRAVIGRVEAAIRERLAQEGVAAETAGRQKHAYGVFRKMRERKRRFCEVVDVYAFRIVVDRVDTCYRVLGLVHNLYKPLPGRFKDHIAIPKSNGYQSLHTVLAGPQGVPIEIQIRTLDMQRNAESGIAAHWMYKSEPGEASPRGLTADWLRNLLEMPRGAGDSEEFLNQVKIDLFPDEVYVFTPKGEILALPKGATVVDFAYAIHSDVGNTCVAARIERRLAALSTALRSGQTVEVITAPGAKPHPTWLRFVVTGKARANIRGYLKNLQRHDAEALGRRLLEAELASFDRDLDRLAPTVLVAYLAEAKLADATELFSEIALGNRLAPLVARRLVAASEGQELRLGTRHRLAIKGTEGMPLTYARCCRPIPGDAVAGLFNPGRGIVVHRRECRNLGDFERQGDRWIELEWDDSVEMDFATEVSIDMANRPGSLASVAAAIAEMGSNIENIQSRERDGRTTTLELLINVRGRQHLARTLRRLRAIAAVTRIGRVNRSALRRV